MAKVFFSNGHYKLFSTGYGFTHAWMVTERATGNVVKSGLTRHPDKAMQRAESVAMHAFAPSIVPLYMIMEGENYREELRKMAIERGYCGVGDVYEYLVAYNDLMRVNSRALCNIEIVAIP